MDESNPGGAWQRFLTGYRLCFALLTFAAVVTEIAVLVERGSFVAGNFFSYFTIESNLFAATVFALSALAGGQGPAMTLLRGAATLFMATTGIVFAILLAGIEDAQFTAVPWDNLVLHYVMPAAVVADWILDLPRLRIAFRTGALWLLAPLAYVAYSLVRGSLVDWYPYPFLDPGESTGAEIGLTIVALLAVGAAVVWLITRSSGATSNSRSRLTSPGDQ